LTNAAEIVLAAQNQGIAIIEEMDDMATKTKSSDSAKAIKASEEPMDCQEMIKAWPTRAIGAARTA
jgi:hypothetical protein